MFLNFFLISIFLFMSIAYYTIMERKLLGSFHFRIGPNKMGILGIFQPFCDVLKLFSKKMNFISKVNEFIWNFSPIFLFILFLMIIIIFPIKMENNNFLYNLIILILILSLPLMFSLFSSLYSFSKFSIISSKRCISQMLSYEMGFMMIIIFMLPIALKLNFEEFIMFLNNQKIIKFILSLFLFLMVLGESGRIPFDFIESESELVSGFNIEFSSIYFSMFFIFEYGMMLFFSLLIGMILNNIFFSILFIYIFIHIRASFPRFRYDQMMMFFWKFLYPILISLFFLFI